MASSLAPKYSDKICAQRKANVDPRQSPALRGERFCHYYSSAFLCVLGVLCG
jgi:hypothetical protein